MVGILTGESIRADDPAAFLPALAGTNSVFTRLGAIHQTNWEKALQQEIRLRTAEPGIALSAPPSLPRCRPPSQSGYACRPHSALPVPAQRPDRGWAPFSTAAVTGAHPMEG